MASGKPATFNAASMGNWPFMRSKSSGPGSGSDGRYNDRPGGAMMTCLPKACRPHHESRRRARGHPVAVDAGLWPPRRPHANARLRGDARGRDGGFREVMATRVKRVTVVAGRAVHVDHRARLRDSVRGFHDGPRRSLRRFDAAVGRFRQNGTRPVQILRDDGRADIRRPWPDRHRAGPAAAAADPWQGSDRAMRRSRHWVKSKNPQHPAVKREAEEDWG